MALAETVKALPRFDAAAFIAKVKRIPVLFYEELYVSPQQARVIQAFLIAQVRKERRPLTWRHVKRLPVATRHKWRYASPEAKTAVKLAVNCGVLPTLAVLAHHLLVR